MLLFGVCSKTCMCKCRVEQHLIVLNLYSVSINKILVTEFITMKYVNTATY